MFNFPATCIVSGIVLDKMNSIDWFDFFSCILNGPNSENFSVVTCIACGTVFVVLLAHAVRVLFKFCSSVDEKFDIVLVSSKQ